MSNNNYHVSMKEVALSDLEHIDIEELLKDREAFSAFIYTPVESAVMELERRWNDPDFKGASSVPDVLKEGRSACLFRQVVTPNYEVRRFVSIIDSTNLRPLFWEYYSDKFTSNNEWKRALGKLFFYEGKGKKNGSKIQSLTIIDFNTYNGKKISEVLTLWGQSLVDFHHEMFRHCFRNMDASFFDASDWSKDQGGSARTYYREFLSLFLKHAILFENFLIDEKEIDFTREIFLPAFIDVWKTSGHKPLIVSLEPTDIEGDLFWMCHPHCDKAFVEERLSRVISSS
jgi:hypothetical protein